jgi:tetratricopeptide (TPR) repeat protein
MNQPEAYRSHAVIVSASIEVRSGARVEQRADEQLAAAARRLDQSDSLARAPLMRRVLQYLVDAARRGEGDRLTPYRVAVEAFGKPESFDPATNASVRVEMARLRRILAAEALKHPGQPCLELPQGSYRVRVRQDPANARMAGRYEYSMPPTGPGLMVVGLECDRVPEARHAAVGMARLLYDELTRYGWLYVVDGLDLEPTRSGLFDQCTQRYACQFLLRGHVAPASEADGISLAIELMDAVGRTTLWQGRFALGPRKTDADAADIAVMVARELAEPFGIITRTGLGRARVSRFDGRWAATELALKYNLYISSAMTPTLHEELAQRAAALLERWPHFALGLEVQGVLARDEYAFRMSGRAAGIEALDRANERLNQAITLNPLLVRARFQLATLSYFRRDIAGFERALEQVLALNGNHPEFLHWGGTYLSLAGRHDQGRALMERAAMLHHGAPLYVSGTLLGLYAQGRSQHAVAALDDVGIDIPSYVMQLCRATVLADVGRTEEAAAALRRAVALMPDLATDLEAETRKWMYDEALAERTVRHLLPLLPPAREPH